METSPTSYNSVIDCRLPHPQLQPFIEQYVYRKILVPKGCCMKKIMPLRSSSSLDFFLGDYFETNSFKTGETTPFIRCMLRGPRTQILYFICIKGEFISFVVKFRPTGLYRLAGLSMDLFTDKALNGNIIDQIPLNKITERLLYAPDISYCISIVEPYLLFLSERSKIISPAIEKAARLLEQHAPWISIAQLANENYLSLRQLERNFRRYIGISPKTYYRVHRFLQLLKAKNNSPEQKWGSLAHEFGYYDQMHLVKEFKEFLNVPPSSFVSSDFAF